jgi:chorismate synthase
MFRFLTSGESHGKCLNAIIDGVPSGFSIDKDFIDTELSRRQIGYGRGGRMEIETDKVEIKAGVRFGVSTGAPVALEIKNKDWENWTVAISAEPVDLENSDNRLLIEGSRITKVRPGHADYAGAVKYNHKDVRNILERSSARETAARVAVGAVAKSILKEFGIEGFSHVAQIGKVKAAPEGNYAAIREKAESSDLRCADDSAYELMKKEIDKAREDGDTLGGSIEIIFENLPVGLGSHVHWDRKLDGKIAQAVMSIQAVKSVEIGLGSEVAGLRGSQTHDEIYFENGSFARKTNNAGGLEGGVTNGERLIVKAAMKAIPTMKKPLKSVDLQSHQPYDAHFERSDVCAAAACGVVAEAMIAIALVEAFLEKFGGDSYAEIKNNFENYGNMVKNR